MVTGTYQLHPPDIRVVSQMLSEVQLIHKLENKGEWVFTSRIDPNEWYKNVVVVVETAACQRFLEQPLRVTFSKQNILR